MKIGEKYALEIANAYMNNEDEYIGITKNGIPESCATLHCKDCLFCNKTKCNGYVKEYLKREYHEQILSDSERECISSVIQPFKNDYEILIGVWFANDQYDRLTINFTDKDMSTDTEFPPFKISEKYKGMTREEWYTPEELGL